MPLLVNFSLRILKEEFAAVGVHLLETFEDGQTRWGNAPLTKPYRGSSCMASEYKRERYDIFTVRGILNRLNISEAESKHVEDRLFLRMNEDPFDGAERRTIIQPGLPPFGDVRQEKPKPS